MDDKTKELIAVGASVGAHCQPCLDYHVAKAREMGIGDDDIREAIGMGHMVEKGAMAAMRDFSAGVLGERAQAGGPGCCSGGKGKSKSCCG